MALLPWRVRNFFSERFPLSYHLVANAGHLGNSPQQWNARLEAGWDDPNYEWPQKVRLIQAALQPGDDILDIACGTGSILRALKADGFSSLHGLETSDYAVSRLSADGFQMRTGRVTSIPWPDGSFEACIASEVLEHVIRRRKFLAEISRVLRPGGQALIFVPDNCLGPIDEPSHVVKFTAERLRKEVSAVLDVVSVESIKEAHLPAPFLYLRAVRKP